MKILRLFVALVLGVGGLVIGGVALSATAVADTTPMVLATGQRIDPAGAIVTLGRGPQDLILTPDASALIVANSGRGTQSFSVVDIRDREHPKETQRLDSHPNWAGLAFVGNTLYAAGGQANLLHTFQWEGPDGDTPGKLVAGDSIALFPTNQLPNAGGFALDIARDVTTQTPTSALPLPVCLFAAGMAAAPDGSEMYVACQESGALAVVDLEGKQLSAVLPIGGFPYGVSVTPDGTGVFVSDWSQPKLVAFTRQSKGVLVPAQAVTVGRHPSAMAMGKDGTLYVTNGNDDSVSVLKTSGSSATTLNTISLSPYKNAPLSSIPTDVALSPDECTLYVALGGNNAAAVVQTGTCKGGSGKPGSLKYVPAGWFPTGVLTSPDGRTLYVISAKGLGSGPNPKESDPGVTTQIFGTLQVVPEPTEHQPGFTKIVRSNNFFDVDRVKAIPSGSSMYDKTLGRSPVIKHVLFVVRENKTFDQVLGDMGNPGAKDLSGNSIYRAGVGADPNLVRYGVANSPNTHALAQKWVTADQFRCPIEESFTGHMWLNFAQTSDYAQRVWTTEDRNTANGIMDTSLPGEGSLLGRAAEAGRSYKTYGWDGLQVSVRPENLKNAAVNTNLAYPTSLQYYTRDIDRIQPLLADIQLGQLPEFSYVWIPNDHGYDLQQGARTPQSMVADNDWAAGKIVEAVSSSSYWENTAVFFVEDDPQSGRDHIDSHRTVFLAASPWIRRGYLTHERYDFSSLHRTIELMLGLRPTSQYEEKAALPLTDIFLPVGEGPDTGGYTAIEPAVSPNDMNPPFDSLSDVLKPFGELAKTVDRSNVDQDADKVQTILDGMYRNGLWSYGVGLAPEPTAEVLAAEARANTAVEEEEEEEADEAVEAVEDDAPRVLGEALSRASSPRPAWPVAAAAVTLGVVGGMLGLAPRRRQSRSS
ncbi:MAG: bifunctional YncE family protein/alkaline phosphatase family protein [Actinomycetota bacterium]